MKPLALLVGLALAACTPASEVPSAADASAAAAACLNIRRVGCALGTDPMCTSALERAVAENHVTGAGLSCASSATSKAALTACGSYFGCP